MIPVNKETTPEIAYMLAIEKAEHEAKRCRRFAFWIPFLSRDFMIKAHMWDYTIDRLKRHQATLGHGSRTKRLVPQNEVSDFTVPARPEDIFAVGE